MSWNNFADSYTCTISPTCVIFNTKYGIAKLKNMYELKTIRRILAQIIEGMERQKDKSNA